MSEHRDKAVDVKAMQKSSKARLSLKAAVYQCLEVDFTAETIRGVVAEAVGAAWAEERRKDFERFREAVLSEEALGVAWDANAAQTGNNLRAPIKAALSKAQELIEEGEGDE